MSNEQQINECNMNDLFTKRLSKKRSSNGKRFNMKNNSLSLNSFCDMFDSFTERKTRNYNIDGANEPQEFTYKTFSNNIDHSTISMSKLDNGINYDSPDKIQTKNNDSDVVQILLSNNEKNNSDENTHFRTSYKCSIDEAYMIQNPYSNFNLFSIELSKNNNRTANSSKSDQNITKISNQFNINNGIFSLRSLKKKNNKIYEDNKDYHKNLGTEGYLIKSEVKKAERKLSLLKNKLNADKKVFVINGKNKRINSINSSITSNENSTNKCNKSTLQENKSSNSVLTNLDQKSLINKYKKQNQEYLNERKNELQLSKLRRNDVQLQSQTITQLEKNRNFKMAKEKSKIIEDLISQTSKVIKQKKSHMTNSLKINHEESIYHNKLFESKIKEKSTNLYKNKINNLKNNLIKLKEECKILENEDIIFKRESVQKDSDSICLKSNINSLSIITVESKKHSSLNLNCENKGKIKNIKFAANNKNKVNKT